MPTVQIPGVGDVSFPDTMSQDEISNVIRTKILPDSSTPAPAKAEPGIASEIGSILKSGAGQGIAGLGKLGQYAGIGGKGLEEYGAGMTKSATEALSPGTQAALQRQFIKEAPEGQGLFGYQLGDAKLTDIPAQFLQSVPVMAGTMAAAAGATLLAPEAAVAGVGTGVLGLLGRVGLGKVAGRIVTAAGAEAGAAEALAGKLAINTLTGNVAEGLAAAGSSGIETEKAIYDFAKSNPDGFFRSPIGQQALKDANGDREKAIDLGAFRAGRSAAALTGVSTAILATPGSAFESLAVFGKGAKAGRLHSAIMGGITEGPAQELPQGSAEQYIQNLQRIQAGEEISPGKGVLEAGVQGAIIGTPIGGALGAVTGAAPLDAKPDAAPSDRRLIALSQQYVSGLDPAEAGYQDRVIDAYHRAAKDVEGSVTEGEELTVHNPMGRSFDATVVGKNDGRTVIKIDAIDPEKTFTLGEEYTVNNPSQSGIVQPATDTEPAKIVSPQSLSQEDLTAKLIQYHNIVEQHQKEEPKPEHYSAQRIYSALWTEDQRRFDEANKKTEEPAVEPAANEAPIVKKPVKPVVTPIVTTPVQGAATPVKEEVVAEPIVEPVKETPVVEQKAETQAAADSVEFDEDAIDAEAEAQAAEQDKADAVAVAAENTATTLANSTKAEEKAAAKVAKKAENDAAKAAEKARLKIYNPLNRALDEFGLMNPDEGTRDDPNPDRALIKLGILKLAKKIADLGYMGKDDLSRFAKETKSKGADLTDAIGTIRDVVESSVGRESTPQSRISTKESRAPKKKVADKAKYQLHKGHELMAKIREKESKALFDKALPRVAKLIADRMEKLGLRVNSKILANIARGGDEVNGNYLNKLIKLAIAGRSDKQIMSTLDHESIHAMRELGMITPEEFNNLKKLADKKGWLKKFYIQSEYDKNGKEISKGRYEDFDPSEAQLKEKGLSREAWILDAQYEEAIADAFATYANGRSPVLGYTNNLPVYVYKKELNIAGQPVGIINRILRTLRIIKDVAGEDAIFKRIEESPREANADKLKAETASPKLSVSKADLGREKTGQLYEVYNRKTGKVVGGPYQTRSAARSGVDRNDNKYGGYAHDVREVQEFGSDEGPEPTKQDLKKAREEEKLEALDEAGVNQKFSVAPAISKNIVQNKNGLYIYKGKLPESFYKWFGKSVATDDDGYPLVMFHGTARDISKFKQKQADAIFVTLDTHVAFNFSELSRAWVRDHLDQFIAPEVQEEIRDEARAKADASSSEYKQMVFIEELDRLINNELPSENNIMPLFVRAENPFDYDNKDHIDALKKQLDKYAKVSKKDADLLNEVFGKVKKGEWESIELSLVQKAIKAEGFDSFYAEEEGHKNLAVYDPNQVKSVTGNSGEYSRESEDIRESVAPKLKKTSDVGHKRELTSGRYVGAPDWVGNSPQQLAVLRTKLRRFAMEGEAGRYWYENSSRAIMAMAGGDKVEAERIVSLIALYSPNATVPANTSMALTAYYQWKSGVPIKAGFGDANRKAESLLKSGKVWSGIKTNAFYQNLMEEIDPSKNSEENATMDMWMALAFDYGLKSLDQGPKYQFSRREIQSLAKELGWKPHQVQAAIWTAIKSRIDSIRQELRAEEVKRGWVRYKVNPIKDGNIKKEKNVKAFSIFNIDSLAGLNTSSEYLYGTTGSVDPIKFNESIKPQNKYDHFKLAHKMGLEYKLNKADIEAGKYDFSNALADRAVQMSYDSIPDGATGVLPGSSGASTDRQMEHLLALERALTGADGKDLIAEAVGLPTGIKVFGYSAWEGNIGAGGQMFLPVALEGSGNQRVIKVEAKKLLDQAAALRGLLLNKKAIVYHVPVFDSSIAQHNGVDIRTNRSLTENEMVVLYRAFNEKFDTLELAPGYTQNGARVLNFVDKIDNLDYIKGVNEIVAKLPEDFGGGVVDSRTYRSEGDRISNDWERNPNGESYIETLRKGRPDLLQRVAVLQSRVNSVNKEFSKKYGWGNPERQQNRGRLSVAPRLGDRGEGREKSGRITPLQGSPSVPSVNGPDSRIVAVAQRYARDNGIDLKRQAEYVEVDPVRGERLANAYVAMLHAPQDPVVKEAYSNLIKQTTAQYRALEAAGYKFWFINFEKPTNQKYAESPWNAIRDLRANQEMGVFPTTSGYGTNEFDVSNNPMLEDTGIKWPDGGIDGPLKTVLANDLFRAVHDAFGHGLEGAGFRADGEENAFQAHIRMYTGSAKGAITSETRGQNSEVNFGPNAEFNRTASGADTIYADQKTGLMPKWTWTEGIAKDEPEFRELDAEQDAEMFRKTVDRVKRGRKMAFPLHVHDVETYRNARLFLSEDKESGFALMGDEIGSFFSGGGGQAYPTLRLAVEEGGRRIDAYRSIMPKVLGKAGFRPVARVAFDPSQATDIWDYKKFEQFQGGTPDLVFFVYDSISKKSEQVEELVKKTPLVQYDEALALQAEAAGELPKQSVAPKLTISPYIGATGSFGGSQIPTTFAAPAASKLTDHIYTWADKFVDLKNLQVEIEKTIGQLDDQYNALQKEELYHAKVAKQILDFMRQEVAPLYEAMKEENITSEQLNKYVHNRHAEERNDQIDKVNQGVVQGIVGKGSGITTKDARDYLNNQLTAQEKVSLERVAKLVDGIMEKTRKLMVSSGLEEQETIDAWEGTYKHYVPLERVMGDPDETNTGFTGQGQGYSVSKSVKRALGSTLDVEHIIANVLATRERTIVRAEKNEIDKALYGLAIKAPNPNVWIAVDPDLPKNKRKNLASLLATFGGFTIKEAQNIAAFPETRSVDRKTGFVTKGRNPNLAKADNVLHLMIKGKEKLIFFNPRNQQANRLVRTLKNLDTANLARGLQTVGAITRYFSAVNTQYNPIFGVINLIRDVQTGLINLESTPIAGMQKQVASDFMPAIKGIWSQLRAEAKGGNGTGKWAALFKEFEQYGGPTGYRDMFASSDDRAKMIESEIKALSRGKIKSGLAGIGSMLSDYNTAFENGVRLAAYKAAIDKGLSKEKAASLAKNLTVNFNRKGDIALQAGALYAFFNASVQGTARILQTMTRIENGKIVITPLGKKIIRGGFLLGVVQAVALAAAGFDDDNPPPFVREKNIIIPLMNGKYLTIPMPLGFNLLPNLSRNITEWAMSGFKDTPKRTISLLESVLTGLNPFGGGFSVQTLVPTVIDPIVALYGNKDAFGRRIAKEDFSSLRETPGYLRTKDTATPWSKGLSEFLNYASGGTQHMKGAISPTPDQIDYLIGQATGGVGRELGKIAQTVSSTVTGEELPSTKIPLVSRFYGDTEEAASQSNKYYTNLSRINSYAAEIKGRRDKPGTGTVAEFIKDVPEARLVPLAKSTYSAIQEIEKLKKKAIERNLPKERIRQFEKLSQERMKQFNRRVDAFQQ